MELLDEVYSMIEDVKNEEEEAYDNMPESLQYSERADTMQEAIDGLEEVLSDLENVKDEIEEIETR